MLKKKQKMLFAFIEIMMERLSSRTQSPSTHIYLSMYTFSRIIPACYLICIFLHISERRGGVMKFSYRRDGHIVQNLVRFMQMRTTCKRLTICVKILFSFQRHERVLDSLVKNNASVRSSSSWSKNYNDDTRTQLSRYN